MGSAELFEVDDAERMNHSCDANCGIQGQIIVVARRAIAANEELTLDYDTFELEPDPFECRCTSPACRRTVVTGNAWQDAHFVEKHRQYLAWSVRQRVDGAISVER